MKYKYLNYIIVTFLLLEYTGILGHNCQSLYQDITSTLNINAREYRRGNQKRTIQRNWQDEEKQKHNILCVGHHYT